MEDEIVAVLMRKMQEDHLEEMWVFVDLEINGFDAFKASLPFSLS